MSLMVCRLGYRFAVQFRARLPSASLTKSLMNLWNLAGGVTRLASQDATQQVLLPALISDKERCPDWLKNYRPFTNKCTLTSPLRFSSFSAVEQLKIAIIWMA